MSNSNDSAGLGCLFLLAIVAGIGYWIYSASNDAGWVPHNEAVDLYFKEEWLVGENKNCTGFQSYPDGPNNSPKLTSLDCADDATFSTKPHNITIKFWGKVSRPEMAKNGLWLSWQCTRTAEGFVCKALN